MTLDEIKAKVDRLSPEEMEELKAYLRELDADTCGKLTEKRLFPDGNAPVENE